MCSSCLSLSSPTLGESGAPAAHRPGVQVPLAGIGSLPVPLLTGTVPVPGLLVAPEPPAAPVPGRCS
ncbi:hypothetical protein FJT64_027281 [Amphibalanus amphitrite]|uniref:Uncharacterized protein n=1 Tax=Amphibalanus amphitrite TaxID=1232801 RepID=A0A6A4W925_AMPAM|nr:hypothetical protein FJT64_027281 [Amphibalanus amphitrite]